MNGKKFKELAVGDKFLRFGENGQLWKKINNSQAEFIADMGEKTAPYGKKPGSLNVFPPTMDVTTKYCSFPDSMTVEGINNL